MEELIVFAPAKLNLYLDVLNRRPDGYHNIKTLFEKIDLKDEIIIRKKGKGITLKIEPQNVCPLGDENIIYKALKALSIYKNIPFNIEITVKKNIPVQAGLGGGSSNAASILRGVNDFFNLEIDKEILLSMASNLGKDVPFFMIDEPFCIAEGTGNELKVLDINNELYHVVLKPLIAMSTKDMYQRFPKILRDKEDNLDLLIAALKNHDIDKIDSFSYNAFEEVLGEHKPIIDKTKKVLQDFGAKKSLLSGSGSSVFCTFAKRGEAIKIFYNMLGKIKSKIFLTKTYRGGIYGNNRS